MKRFRTSPALGALLALAAAPISAPQAAVPMVLHAQTPVAPAARGWIGVSFEIQSTGDGTTVRTVAFVTDVMRGSPAADAGLRPGDVLVSINGRPWSSEIAEVTRHLRPGDPLTLVVERAGRRQELRVRAGARPAQVAAAEPSWTMFLRADSTVERLYKAMDSLRIRIATDPGIRMHLSQMDAVRDSVLRTLELERGRIAVLRGTDDVRAPRLVGEAPIVTFFRRGGGDSLAMDSLWGAHPFPTFPPEAPQAEAPFRPLTFYALGEKRAAGAEVVELRPELGEYFNVDGGVLVVDVAPGTPAHRAGILPGDVLTELNGAALRSVADLRRGISRTAPEFRVRLVRKGQTIQVVLRN
jgi:predicted metalloprotease with PDZ domain